MFTGLIEAVCIVKKLALQNNAAELTIDLAKLADDAAIGDSVAINGACLTINRLQQTLASFDVSPETLRLTNLAKLTGGSSVNTERALKPSGRFGGHFVQGHVDGTATIEKIDQQRDFWQIKFSADQNLLEQMVLKGSVAVNGISLTVADIDRKSFTVSIIPETLRKTTLAQAKASDIVNIETDIICKTVKKQLEKILPQKEPMTVEKLKQLGF